MKKIMYIVSVGSVFFSVVCFVLYDLWKLSFIFSLAVTFVTIAYHFLMRLAVGLFLNKTMKNHADYSKWWFQCRAWEKKLYKILRIRRWKNKLPTFEPDVFNPKLHSWDEIAQAMCQSELVHETIVALSFLPIAFSIWFGALTVFIITSVISAAFDLLFVIIQRYNRPRIIRLIKNESR